MRGPIGESDNELQGRALCDELLAWLKTDRRQKHGANLQEQINEAQQAGDIELLLELLRKKQEVSKKNSENVDNLLKK